MATEQRPDQHAEHRQGIVYGLLAYGLWGLVPLYFRLVRAVPPVETLMHRVVWCALLLAIVVTLARRWRDVGGVFRKPKLLAALAISAGLISANWLLYIYCVVTERIADASLGYFITPLISVVLGFVFLRERLRPLQWTAVAVAAGGCVWL